MHIFKHTAFALSVLLIVIAVCGCGEKKPDTPKIIQGTKKIITVPEGASILYNGKEIGKTPYTLKAKPKFYTIKLSKTGYDDLYTSFTIKNGKNPEETFKLVKAQTSVLIVSDPSGAYVTFRGKRLGETPCVISDLTFGQYEVTLSKAGHASKDIPFTISSIRPSKISTELESNIGYISITSTPSKASIYLDGKEIGRTPFKGEYVDGTYEFTLRSQNYIESTFTAVVEKGKTVNKNFELMLKPGSFDITTEPVKAKIFWDGKFVGESPITIDNQQANTEHILEITAENFATQKHKLTVSPGKKEPLNYTLKRNRGDMQLIASQPGVTIFINGEKFHKVPQDLKNPQTFNAKDLRPGIYTVRYYHHRAQPTSKTKKFKISAGETTTVEKMDLWIPNAKLIYNDDTSEKAIIIQETSNSYYVELEKGMRYSVPKKHLRKIEYFKD